MIYNINLRNGLEAACRIACDGKNHRSIIDVGSGGEHHKNFFRLFFDEVYTNDFDDRLTGQNYPGDFMKVDFDRKFQYVYCSNVLEHIRNQGKFIEKLFSICEDDGYVCIIVPRAHLNKLLSGHISTWSLATLVYSIVVSGFDCSDAIICNGKFEKSIIVPNKKIPSNEFTVESGVVGDVGNLNKYFPFEAIHKGSALVDSVGWPEIYNFPLSNKYKEITGKYLSSETYRILPGTQFVWKQEDIKNTNIGTI
ncbi:methyltransferase domain-containing protein [Brevundimonas sp. BH3]|uniref:methyltransferase domain-containing protein n=1 Tax=Brevundimonas sp. BH3 TaxID=3133089 RepID=UPI00324DAA6F